MSGWFARTLLLVLAGFATLTLIASIASVPSGSSVDAPVLGPSGERVVPPVSDGTAREVVVAAAPPSTSPERWLEPIAYALMALAGFAAAALVVLLRIAGHLADLARRD